MAYGNPAPGSLKRKRRRRPDKPPVHARLRLDHRIEGDSALLSVNLFKDLFPGPASVNAASTFVAIASKSASLQQGGTLSAPWTILPCRPDASSNAADGPSSTLRIPRNLQHGHAFANLLPPASGYRPPIPNSALDVVLLDVVPIPLTTVFVSIDLDDISKYWNIEKHYEGGLPSDNGVRQADSTRLPLNQLPTPAKITTGDAIALVRSALASALLLHIDDVIPLPLPHHPITDASCKPVSISQCEPVAQGTLTADTRIVLLPQSRRSKLSSSAASTLSNGTHVSIRPSSSLHLQAPLPAETDEDENSEAFFTADDSREASTLALADPEHSQSTEDDTTDLELDLSDDPDDIITLTSPGAASFRSGAMSAMASATPRLLGHSQIHTPGSIHSNMTSTTIRGSTGHRSKTLKTQPLFQSIPSELLFPKPPEHEDPEARVFVDTAVLAQIGCFSGDWLALEPTDEPPKALGLASLAMSLFADHHSPETAKYRPLKVYALPGSLSIKSPRYPLKSTETRRSSVTSVPPIADIGPQIFLPPVLFANLDSPKYARITRLTRASNPESMSEDTTKIPPTSFPIAAAEVNLALISTQASLVRPLQPAIFANLREYFAKTTRQLKAGDLIAISIDRELGIATAEASVEPGDGREILPVGICKKPPARGSMVCIWYLVRDAIAVHASGREDSSVWNGLVSVDTSATILRTGSVEQMKIPSSLSNPWQYYHNHHGIAMSDGQSRGMPKAPMPYVAHVRRRLRNLVAVASSGRAHDLGLPALAVLLSSTQRGAGKSYTADRACSDVGVHCYTIDALDIAAEAAGGAADSKSELTLKHRFNLAMSCGPHHTCVLVRHVENLKGDRMINVLREAFAEVRIMIATTTEVDKLPDALRAIFTHEIELSAPDEAERQGILQSAVRDRGLSLAQTISLSSVAVKTAALVAEDLVDVVDRAVLARDARLEALSMTAPRTEDPTVRDVLIAGGPAISALTTQDFDKAVESARKNFADSIGAPKIPKVQWSDVGGLASVKDAIMETIQLPLSRPELFAKGLKKRSGILFYGPPGTGKTLLAKAIATEFSLNFFSVKGPELLNMYIGESEANVRRVFQRARDAKPCVVFFDELDSVAPKRGNQGDSGGVMDRIVSQLLAELDGMSGGDEASGGAGVFVIGATNRPDLLDQALLRPGRFDKMLYLGISDTHDKQARILEALTRKVASKLPFTYTGADLYALCSDSMLRAITRSASAVDKRVAALNATREPGKRALTVAQFFDHLATQSDTDVVVREDDFEAARRELVPSVSLEELGHYERVRHEFEGDKGGRDARTDTGLDGSELPLDSAVRKAFRSAQAGGQLPANATQAELEAYQARRIDELMAAGFADGSLPRNSSKQPSAQSHSGPADADIDSHRSRTETIMARSSANGFPARNMQDKPHASDTPLRYDPRSPRTNGRATDTPSGMASPLGTPGTGVAGLDALVAEATVQTTTSADKGKGRATVRNDSRMRRERGSVGEEADSEAGFDEDPGHGGRVESRVWGGAEDEMLIRSRALKLNDVAGVDGSSDVNGTLGIDGPVKGIGHAQATRNPESRGRKGKGKMRVEEGGFGDAALDEGLYD